MGQNIEVKGAQLHNLKNINLTLQKNSFTVITGPSGSGKSSLAFDTIHAEGMRRYMDALLTGADFMMPMTQSIEIAHITGLSPTVAIDQKMTSLNPRSVVATVTEVYDFLRLFYAKLGTAHCPESKNPLISRSPEEIVESLISDHQGKRLQILAPVLIEQRGEHKELIDRYIRQGFQRARVQKKEILPLEDIKLFKTKNNNLDIVIDRIVIREQSRERLLKSLNLALKHANGFLYCLIDHEELFFSQKLYSPWTKKSYPELSSRHFSFNSPLGACPACGGLGEELEFDPNLFIENPKISLSDGVFQLILKKGHYFESMIEVVLNAYGKTADTPYSKWPKKLQEIILYGDGKIYEFSFDDYSFKKRYEGLISFLKKHYEKKSYKDLSEELQNLMSVSKCQECQGDKLNEFSRHVKIKGVSLPELCHMGLDKALVFLEQDFGFEGLRKEIANKLLIEIRSKIVFLCNVGLGYLSLYRRANTLSGGEYQRIRLATQLGLNLSGVIYILDEPSIGLHQRDNLRLIETLKELKNKDNTLIVVEHDEETMLQSDYFIEIGPGAGSKGGEVVVEGALKDLLKEPKGMTLEYLTGKRQVVEITKRLEPQGFYEFDGVHLHNIRQEKFSIPLKVFCAVTGVSGSGKSTMVHRLLVPSLKQADEIEKVIEISQAPIGRTPKSNPATYTKVFDWIRDVFATSSEAKLKGYSKSRFSFNTKEGRCPTCEGAGQIKSQMNFLEDVYTPCEDCQGQRFRDETLDVRYRGYNIAEVLDMTVSESLDYFQNHPRIKRFLQTLADVGLGYIKLGQPSPTLSGGEAQRIKLARELSKRNQGHCFYVLDEPTTGLHFNDIKMLIEALLRLRDQGHSLLVIEHNLDMIKAADYIIDMGPEGGEGGGLVIAEGTPEKVSKVKGSYTGQYLKPLLNKKASSK